MEDSNFLWLLDWYKKHCNGDWEHSNGIHIGTIDNPGWSLTINLEDTELEDVEFEKIENDKSENDWLTCFIHDKKFEGRCSLNHLSSLLQIFRQWAEKC